MKKRIIKLIVCVMLISALMIGFCSAYASASSPVWLLRAKAAIAAAMLASNLVIDPVNFALDDAIAEGIDPSGYVLNIQETPWEVYLEKSVIKVVPDSVYIDGVPYSDLWLGPDAAESLRLAGLDFASAYNILSNQSQAITYASGVGYIVGAPAFLRTTDNYYVTQAYSFNSPSNFTIGDSTVNATIESTGWHYPHFSVSLSNPSFSHDIGGIYGTDGSTTGFARYTVPVSDPNWITFNFYYNDNDGIQRRAYYAQTIPGSFVSQPFNFDYMSGVIDAPLAEDDGLLIRVPSSYNNTQSPQYNYDIHDLINIYPQVTQDHGAPIEIDPDLNPDFQTDIDLGNSVGDLIRIVLQILDLLDNVDIEFAPEPESPEPGPVDPDYPDPDVPIGDQDPIWMDDLLRWIKNAIDNLGDRIQNAIESIHEDLTDLADKILEDIELGPAKLFDKALDILKTLFLPLLIPIRAMMNLWHYVVEWIQSISSPFTWIFGIMSGTSYNMVLPIYALLAGGICISIYKALGR